MRTLTQKEPPSNCGRWSRWFVNLVQLNCMSAPCKVSSRTSPLSTPSLPLLETAAPGLALDGTAAPVSTSAWLLASTASAASSVLTNALATGGELAVGYPAAPALALACGTTAVGCTSSLYGQLGSSQQQTSAPSRDRTSGTFWPFGQYSFKRQ